MADLQTTVRTVIDRLEKGKKIQIEYDKTGKLKVIELSAHIVLIDNK